MKKQQYAYKELGPDSWADFELLFGPSGACAGCWCTHWRRPRKEHEAGKGEENKAFIKDKAHSNEPVGLILYVDNAPAGWISVAPRQCFPGLGSSRLFKPIDDIPVWSISCFFVLKEFRRQGLGKVLLESAIEFVHLEGGKVLEGYPTEPKKTNMPPVFAWTGFAETFRRAGFKEVARPSETRPLMRFVIDD